MHLAPLEQVSRLNMYAARAAIDKSSKYSFNFTAAAKDTGLLLDKASGSVGRTAARAPDAHWAAPVVPKPCQRRTRPSRARAQMTRL